LSPQAGQVNADTEPHGAATILRCAELSAGYGKRAVVRGVSCRLVSGEVLGIVGPNGSGKSTLLKALSGAFTLMGGQVWLDGQTLGSLPRQQRARLLAMLPQHPEAPPGMTVSDLVHCGRAPHTRWFAALSRRDREAIDSAIESCGVTELLHRPLAELSGGERQRAWIAMTLAQQTRVLLLDEPTSALDIGHQLDVLHLLRRLSRQRQLAIALVMHDLNMALRYCDRLLVLRGGEVVGESRTGGSLDPALLEQTFGVRASAATTPDHSPQLIFKRRIEGAARPGS
jgi:iron complex transport system ATP-binding protein